MMPSHAVSPLESSSDSAPHDPRLGRVLGFCCAALAGVAIFLALTGGSEYLGSLDFRVYLTAGRLAQSGAGADFYDLPTQFAAQRTLWPQMTRQDQLLPFLAPPFVSILFAPLAAMPLGVGYCVWTAFNAFLLWLIARDVTRELRLEGRGQLFALALMLTFAPVLFALMQGQVSLLGVLGFLRAWQNAKAGRDFRAGLWLSLLLIRPQMLLLPALIFVLKKRWKLIGGLALGAAILGALSLVLVGWQGLQNYAALLGQVANWQGIYGVQSSQMQTWRGFLFALSASGLSVDLRWAWGLGALGAAGALLFCWRGAWQTDESRFERQWAALGLAALFCCPYLYAHDLSLLVVCGALIFRAARTEKSRLGVLPVLSYGVTVMWIASLAVLPRAWPIMVLFEAGALAALVWSERSQSRNEKRFSSEVVAQV